MVRIKSVRNFEVDGLTPYPRIEWRLVRVANGMLASMRYGTRQGLVARDRVRDSLLGAAG